MKGWYEADETWWAIGIKNREEYIDKYVLEGKFHEKVPEDVVNSFHTAEYLMAHAWYHYPMYDEAVKKLLGIFEMTVKLKWQALGFDLEYENKRGKKVAYKLAELINKICSFEKEKGLIEQLHNVRELRNYHAHPKRYSFVGGSIAQQSIIPLINILNMLFLDSKTVLEAKQELIKLKEHSSQFADGLFVLERGEGKGVLITQASPAEVFKINGEWISFWSCLPVLSNAYKMLSNNKYPPPITIGFSDVTVKDNDIVGREIRTESEVLIKPTSKPLNQEKLKQYQQEMNLLTQEQRLFYSWSVRREVTQGLNKFKYLYYWN
jgi:hypothetical protein